MKNVVVAVALLMFFLPTVCSVHAYVYYVEAENFDPDTSMINVAGCTWTITADENVSNENYMKYSGPHSGANTSLLYTLPDIDDNPGQIIVWFQHFSPNNWTDSFFVYVSTDGGGEWGPQQTVSTGMDLENWLWTSFTPTTPFESGEGNVLKVSEREDANLDLICIRNDGAPPSAEEYVVWLEDWESIKIAVEPIHRITTTWGKIRSGY